MMCGAESRMKIARSAGRHMLSQSGKRTVRQAVLLASCVLHNRLHALWHAWGERRKTLEM